MANRNGYTAPNVAPPSRKKPVRLTRGSFGIVLCILIPPLGILYLWRLGVFKVRGRVLITSLSTALMALVISLMLPVRGIQTETPLPSTPARATPAPEGEVKTALSNIDQLLYQKQLEDVIAQGGSERDLLTDAEQLELERQEQEAILNTIVYAYNGSGARYYHAAPVCGNQSNGRKLTVGEAMQEHLGAGDVCNPPVYGLGSSTFVSGEAKGDDS